LAPSRRKVVAPLILSLLLTLIVAPDAHARGSRLPKYDGETLFRGLIFGTGPAAKEFPEIWERADMKRFMAAVKRQNQTDPENARAAVMNQLRNHDAAFFTDFEAEMQSGDHLRIQKTLYDTATILHDLVQPALDANAAQLKAQGDEASLVDELTIGPAVAVAAAIALAIAVVIAVVLWLWGFIWLPVLDPLSRSAPQLQTDVLVDLIATRLGPAL
jgi:SdpC family antimicrobial peptide